MYAAIVGQPGGPEESSARIGVDDSQSSRFEFKKVFCGAVLGIGLPAARDRRSEIARTPGTGFGKELAIASSQRKNTGLSLLFGGIAGDVWCENVPGESLRSSGFFLKIGAISRATRCPAMLPYLS